MLFRGVCPLLNNSYTFWGKERAGQVLGPVVAQTDKVRIGHSTRARKVRRRQEAVVAQEHQQAVPLPGPVAKYSRKAVKRAKVKRRGQGVHNLKKRTIWMGEDALHLGLRATIEGRGSLSLLNVVQGAEFGLVLWLHCRFPAEIVKFGQLRVRRRRNRKAELADDFEVDYVVKEDSVEDEDEEEEEGRLLHHHHDRLVHLEHHHHHDFLLQDHHDLHHDLLQDHHHHLQDHHHLLLHWERGGGALSPPVEKAAPPPSRRSPAGVIAALGRFDVAKKGIGQLGFLAVCSVERRGRESGSSQNTVPPLRFHLPKEGSKDGRHGHLHSVPIPGNVVVDDLHQLRKHQIILEIALPFRL
ncbi:hypothetical protein TYRP_000809 [Tyrophagus putrescentiae]|nr:hypothetical protein TYRP_000809 [Tyrophagus putrescentiae]